MLAKQSGVGSKSDVWHQPKQMKHIFTKNGMCLEVKSAK
jgi:hypothetical protein